MHCSPLPEGGRRQGWGGAATQVSRMSHMSHTHTHTHRCWQQVHGATGGIFSEMRYSMVEAPLRGESRADAIEVNNRPQCLILETGVEQRAYSFIYYAKLQVLVVVMSDESRREACRGLDRKSVRGGRGGWGGLRYAFCPLIGGMWCKLPTLASAP